MNFIQPSALATTKMGSSTDGLQRAWCTTWRSRSIRSQTNNFGGQFWASQSSLLWAELTKTSTILCSTELSKEVLRLNAFDMEGNFDNDVGDETKTF